MQFSRFFLVVVAALISSTTACKCVTNGNNQVGATHTCCDQLNGDFVGGVDCRAGSISEHLSNVWLPTCIDALLVTFNGLLASANLNSFRVSVWTDVLEQFSRQPEPQSATSEVGPTSPVTSPPPPPPTATASTFSGGRPRTNTRVDAPPVPMPGNGPGFAGLAGVTEEDGDALAADFAAELAKGMESLMREISGPTEGSSSEGGPLPNEEELKAAWEAMLIESMNGLTEGANGGPAASSNGADSAANDFQAKIKQAMGKLKEGEDALKDADGSSSTASDPLAALLASLGGDGDGDLPTNETELAGLLENMMGELMSKEILYDPLKELAEKFPPYLQSPPAPIPADDRKRYEDQLDRVKSILALFDSPTYSDEDPKSRESVVALMAEMQSFGSPPAELMGPVPPGFDMLGQDCVVC
ncbi:hypothetical protein MIND_00949900 [Mycena indigotica]|uniref:Peroxin-19 n=1 Tax=Mycena indigotica TaxID=2126181 RepID=A0A8H6W0K1_9AGAR|nr:uncharacterized protein MIND_00949900 [Mycena indigotica]KAF7297168.1 hypothetical protein MIND_00949900 [Mycena indigotica]